MWLAIELVPRSFWFTLRKKWQSDREVEGPQKKFCKAYIIHSHGPMRFVVGEALVGKEEEEEEDVVMSKFEWFFLI